MDVQKLIDDVERLRALIKSWSAAGPAGALERDLVLEKLSGFGRAVGECAGEVFLRRRVRCRREKACGEGNPCGNGR